MKQTVSGLRIPYRDGVRNLDTQENINLIDNKIMDDTEYLKIIYFIVP